MSGFGYNVNGFGAFPSRGSTLSVDIMAAGAGGGGGANLGGGGGGGLVVSFDGQLVKYDQNYTVTIGAGWSCVYCQWRVWRRW
jgi:hypothetical protein